MVEQLIFCPDCTENITTILLFNRVTGNKGLIFQVRSIYFQKINKTAKPQCSIDFIDVSLGNIEIFHEQFSH